MGKILCVCVCVCARTSTYAELREYSHRESIYKHIQTEGVMTLNYLYLAQASLVSKVQFIGPA